MATFSPTDAALEGFRFAREQPRVVLWWAAIYLVVTALLNVLLVTYAGDVMMELRATEEAGGGAEPMSMAVLQRMLPISLLGLAITMIFAAGVYRAVLRPADGGWAYLKLGRDELRLALLAFIFVGLTALVSAAIVMVLGILAAIVTAVGGGADDSPGMAVVALIGAVASLALLPAFVWAWVRLSLAWPMTFAERRLVVFGSWRLTKGRFWRLFGAYVLATILAILIWLLGMIIYAAVAAILTGGVSAVGKVFEPDMSSLGAYFTPAMMIYTLFAGLFGPLQYLILFAPGAVAYRELTAGEG